MDRGDLYVQEYQEQRLEKDTFESPVRMRDDVAGERLSVGIPSMDTDAHILGAV